MRGFCFLRVPTGPAKMGLLPSAASCRRFAASAGLVMTAEDVDGRILSVSLASVRFFRCFWFPPFA